VPITKLRGQVVTREDGLQVYLTVHPSFILRIQEPAAAADERMRFLNDLKDVKRLMGV
jgi:uracil-DNA glycosylase